jgi:hypothetical protein
MLIRPKSSTKATATTAIGTSKSAKLVILIPSEDSGDRGPNPAERQEAPLS